MSRKTWTAWMMTMRASAAAGLPRAGTGEGDPPTYRTQTELWDQPHQVDPKTGETAQYTGL